MKTLQQVQEKILKHITVTNPTPAVPIAFALFLLETLDESDFEALENFEKQFGEEVATAWLNGLLVMAGVQLGEDAHDPAERRVSLFKR